MAIIPPAPHARPRLPRRQFVQITALGLTGLLCPPVAQGAPADALAGLARPGLLDVLGNADLVRALGRQYLAATPAEHGLHVLADAILPDATVRPPDQVATAIAARVRDDFAAARTVVVEGWILSVTEARQCALYALHVA